MKPTRRAVIYVRMSQDRSGEGAGVERQLSDCQELAARRNYEVIETLVENDTSAYRHQKQRPKWQQLVAMVEAGAVDVIVAWHTDRLYRHPKDLEKIIDDVVRHVTIDTCRSGEMDLGTDNGQMVARILGATARQEVARKADRQARALAEKAKTGAYHGGRRPLGHEADGVTIRESEAAVLREAARMLLANVSLAETSRFVSDALNYPERLLPKRHPEDPDVAAGTPLVPRVLRLALTAPRMAGYREYWPQADREQVASGRVAQPSVTLYEAEWPGILDRETWGALRAKLKHDRRRSEDRPVRRSLLAGLVRCGHPDCTEQRMGFNGHSYACSRQRGGCGRVAITAKSLEALILGMAGARLAATDLGALVAPPPASEAERARRDLQERFDALLPLYDERLITAAELRERRRLLKAELEKVEALEGEAQIHAAELSAMYTTVQAWDAATPAEQATVLRALLRTVLIRPSPAGRRSGSKFDPGRVVVDWADGPKIARGSSPSL
jgi:site-specific DNA recombinase